MVDGIVMWSPTGKARGTIPDAPVGRHLPTDVGTHSSTAIPPKAGLLPGSKYGLDETGGKK
jgi:hypothetical protein